MIKRFLRKMSKVLNPSKDFTKNHNEYEEKAVEDEKEMKE